MLDVSLLRVYFHKVLFPKEFNVLLLLDRCIQFSLSLELVETLRLEESMVPDL